MSVTIALAGNPNSGKTTLFNALTGSNQFVGNWPGVTVEKKEGKLRGRRDVFITDLPGIYSLSPYSPEEIVSRNYLIDQQPDAILNIIDGTNLERNLYLTTQLAELGIPVVVAVNMMDIIRKNGDKIDSERLSVELGCQVVEISALKGDGVEEAASAAVAAAARRAAAPRHSFSGNVEHAIAHIEEAALHKLPEERQRWYAVKLFERDGQIAEKLGLGVDILAHIERDIALCEEELDNDSESIITVERYKFIDSIISECCTFKSAGRLSVSDKIDRVVTNRWAALPIFAAIMFVVYFVSVTSVGALATEWAGDGVFGRGWHLFGIGSAGYEQALSEDGGADPSDFGVWVPGVPVLVGDLLETANCADWLRSLVLDGIVAGVGAVLGFVPQMLILFMFLAFLEACGYMARIAFIMDRVFRRFGLSGKSFIPILIGAGCGVPGIMSSRTIESARDRRMTIITTTFIPCGAKLPIIALIAGAMFDGAWWVAPSAYFAGMAAIVCSGVILKKTKLFSGDAAPFVMELPSYHMPTAVNILRSMWERGWSFVKKAGSIILLATVFVWFTSSYGWTDGTFGPAAMTDSILAAAGRAVAWVFIPLGWGQWKAAVAAVTGLVAKENVVGTFGILYGFAEVAEDGTEIWSSLSSSMSQMSAYSLLMFNLLCAPCFAAIGAIRREMNSPKWFWVAIGYQTALAYFVSLCVYRIGSLFADGEFGLWTAVSILLLAGFIYLLVRRPSASDAVIAR